MKTTSEFLKQIKETHHLPSDGRLAVKLGLTRSAVSRFMQGKDFLGDETAMKVAVLLDIDAAYVVACAHAERAKHAGEKRLWERIAAMTAGVAAMLVLSVGILQGGNQFDSGEFIAVNASTSGVQNIHYAYFTGWLCALVWLYHLTFSDAHAKSIRPLR